MENQDDELIQQWIEDPLKAAQEKDGIKEAGTDAEAARMYALLFQELAGEPVMAVDFELADRVVEEIVRKQIKAESMRYGFVIAGVSLGFVLVMLLALTFVSPGVVYRTFEMLKGNYPIIVFIGLAVTAIQALDRLYFKKDRSFSAAHR